MDMIENLAKQASQITMYDIKSYYNSAKNSILNVPEMEAKVREATNDDAWGASSTLMQQIAEGNEFNIIMPCIYSRFMEKEAREWRQIYKALTLLEFLVKNGSERVVDDARAHISTIKMLRSFHYVDEKGKDQGINVRNRASEIATMLGDVEAIRRERRKAKANRSKYQGHEGGGGGGGMSFVTAGGSRYGGFGSDSVGHGGSGGGGGGGSGGDYDGADDYRRRDYNSSSRSGPQSTEYDEYEGADDFDDRAAAPRRTGSSSTGTSRPGSRPQVPAKGEPKPKAAEKKPEVNLFDFDDDPVPSVAPAASTAAPILGGDDDFDDFQTAPTATASAAAPAPAAAARPQGNAGLFDLLNTGATSSPAKATAPPSFASMGGSNGIGMQAPLSAAPAASRPNYTSPPLSAGAPMTSPPLTSPTLVSGGGGAKKTSGSAFDDLWTSSLTSTAAKPTPAGGVQGKSIKDLEKEKAMDKLWGSSTQGQSNGAGGQKSGGQFDDLLF